LGEGDAEVGMTATPLTHVELVREAEIIRKQSERCRVVALVEARMARERVEALVKLEPVDLIDLS
jgi:hypothetical protein